MVEPLDLDRIRKLAADMAAVSVSTTTDGMVTLQCVSARLPVLVEELETARAENERLREELEAERLWIKEGRKLHEEQKAEIERLRAELKRCKEALASYMPGARPVFPARLPVAKPAAETEKEQ